MLLLLVIGTGVLVATVFLAVVPALVLIAVLLLARVAGHAN